MNTQKISLIFATTLLILYGMISAVATICPDESAFVFCSVVFTQYVELVIYICDLSEQFHLVFPWQR